MADRSGLSRLNEMPATEDLVDLTPYIRSGDTVAWTQACGEPQLLLESLLAQRHEFGRIRAFAVSSFSKLLQPEHADTIDFVSIGGLGELASLARHSALEILPVHLESVPRLIATGALQVDVALIQVSDATGP